MKRLIAAFLVICLVFSLVACRPGQGSGPVGAEKRIHLSDLVGVWTEKTGERTYRFTPTGVWVRYNAEGEVVARGTVTFDGKDLTLSRDGTADVAVLTAKSAEKITDGDTVFHRIEAQAFLSETERYKPYFATWYENADLGEATLTIDESDLWVYSTAGGTVLARGSFAVFAEEEDTPYLFTDEDEFYGTLCLDGNGLTLTRFEKGGNEELFFAAEEDSRIVYSYFKDKGIAVNYRLGDGARLLRNGGGVFNDQRDYKRMSVNCSASASGLSVSGDTASFDVEVRYAFRKSDMPAMTGRIYNTVLYSQYDYYSGELFTMEDSTGNDVVNCVWETDRDGEKIRIDCAFSSLWDYPQGEDVFVRWVGTYHLTMPVDYDGLILCLRPVFNSYSAQVSSESVLQEDTLALEDLGEDVEKCIFCRVRVQDIPAEDNAFNLTVPEVRS